MTHWKNLADNNYIGAYSFADNVNEIVVTIKDVKRDKVTAPGGKVDYCIIAYFNETNVLGVEVKPMILNKTNCKAIEKALGTPYTEQWVGHRITIYKTTTKFQRDVVDCLRIRETAPKAKYTCSVCGKEITEKIYKGSVEAYGVALCSAECKAKYEESKKENIIESEENNND